MLGYIQIPLSSIRKYVSTQNASRDREVIESRKTGLPSISPSTSPLSSP